MGVDVLRQRCGYETFIPGSDSCSKGQFQSGGEGVQLPEIRIDNGGVRRAPTKMNTAPGKTSTGRANRRVFTGERNMAGHSPCHIDGNRRPAVPPRRSRSPVPVSSQHAGHTTDGVVRQASAGRIAGCNDVAADVAGRCSRCRQCLLRPVAVRGGEATVDHLGLETTECSISYEKHLGRRPSACSV